MIAMTEPIAPEAGPLSVEPAPIRCNRCGRLIGHSHGDFLLVDIRDERGDVTRIKLVRTTAWMCACGYSQHWRPASTRRPR